MKILFRGLLLIVGVLAAAYYFMSRPIYTIDDLYNPDRINNLHLIDANQGTGFAIYRLGEPGPEDMEGLCRLGVTEMLVLAGTAAEVELKYQDHCPTLKVVYNVQHLEGTGYSDQFLAGFDRWVERARAEGRKIAFRCTCGCHRTGKLAAYYQMKYRGMSPKDAWDLSLSRGHLMYAVDYWGGLQQQVLGLYDHIQGQPCEQGMYCVQKAEPQGPCDDPLTGCGWAN